MTNTQFERMIVAIERMSATLSRVEDILLRNEAAAHEEARREGLAAGIPQPVAPSPGVVAKRESRKRGGR